MDSQVGFQVTSLYELPVAVDKRAYHGAGPLLL